jgi:hypothetical protein
MSELRLTGKNPEGTHLTLTNPIGEEFTIRISDTLRATVNQPRLAAVAASDDVETMSVKEIQRRLRSGETMDAIARDGHISVEKSNVLLVQSCKSASTSWIKLSLWSCAKRALAIKKLFTML